jgi:hypothetical protein
LSLLENLPLPVQNYFKFALKEGQRYIQTVTLSHTGNFRQDENQKWFNIKGEEYFTTTPPGFVWYGRINVLPMIWLTGIDKLVDGNGSFQVKLLSFVTISDAPSGIELNESELMRWLAEAPLLPTSLLPGDYLQWKQLNDNSIAKAIVHTHGVSVELIFHFDKYGKIIHVEGQRYRTINNEYLKQTWRGYYSNYVSIENMMIPLNIEVKWNSQKGDFTYAKFKIKDIRYGY